MSTKLCKDCMLFDKSEDATLRYCYRKQIHVYGGSVACPEYEEFIEVW